jgi:predicted dehydrogenase
MVRTHPQWLMVRELVRGGELGELCLVTCQFSYDKRDPVNIRNRLEYGGGALFDIGCYPITLSRWLYDAEPRSVMALLERDPELRIDRLTSALLQFPSGQCVFSCATQLAPYQRMHIHGTRARVEVEIPFNAPPDRPCRVLIDDTMLAGVHHDLPVTPIRGRPTTARSAAGICSYHSRMPCQHVRARRCCSAETGRWERFFVMVPSNRKRQRLAWQSRLLMLRPV